MEKSIFLFNRKPDRSPSNFDNHYITNHAPLGKKLTRCLRGYTVNLVGTENNPAAVTEHWVPTVMDILTPERAYASMEDFNTVLVDDQSLFNGFDLYVVTGERIVVDGPIPPAPLEEKTPGVKLIERIASGDAPPPPRPGAVRVVDNIVSHKLVMTEDYKWLKADPEMAILRMSWFEDGAELGDLDQNCLVTKEYRFIEPAKWD